LSIQAIDAFAGLGGWDLALERLGVSPLGIEWDDAACATREAAGLRTLQADVSALDPLDVGYDEGGAYDRPCIDLLIASPPCQPYSNAGKGEGKKDVPLILSAAAAIADGKALPPLSWHDDRSPLVVEPLRWALALEPRFIAWEQVKEVLPFWELCAAILRGRGWSVWTGLLDAEQFGVPQTRRRAILIADREGGASAPAPTHHRYMGRGSRKGDSLFHPGRRVHPDDVGLLPWVSMAEGLGWDGPGLPTALRSGQTVAGGERAERSINEPAVAVTTRADNNSWVFERPATAVCGDPRITAPGRADRDPGYKPGDTPPSNKEGAVRVTLEEALALQSFPPDYPVQGTKSQRFLQVGNAVPPLLAHAILSALLAPVLTQQSRLEALA
jgi:DNA (cytosine-5)-methyltransferase 1